MEPNTGKKIVSDDRPTEAQAANRITVMPYLAVYIPSSRSKDTVGRQRTVMRMVSMGAYLRARVAEALLNLSMIPLALLIVPSCLLAFLSGVLFCFNLVGFLFVGIEALVPCFAYLSGCLLFSALAYSGIRLYKLAIEKSDKIDPGIPLTRANTTYLPAYDTLVRASSEPEQAQEAVLLRAAIEGKETPPEQLVRPAGGLE